MLAQARIDEKQAKLAVYAIFLSRNRLRISMWIVDGCRCLPSARSSSGRAIEDQRLQKTKSDVSVQPRDVLQGSWTPVPRDETAAVEHAQLGCRLFPSSAFRVSRHEQGAAQRSSPVDRPCDGWGNYPGGSGMGGSVAASVSGRPPLPSDGLADSLSG